MSEPGLVRCKVTGAMPIRDYVTKESVQPGDVVQLKPRPHGTAEPGTVVIEALVAAGAVEVLEDKAKSDPKAKS